LEGKKHNSIIALPNVLSKYFNKLNGEMVFNDTNVPSFPKMFFGAHFFRRIHGPKNY
jgi:hypothetical protein